MPYNTKEKQDEWNRNNQDKLKASRRRTYLKYREQRIAVAKEYQTRNREHVNALERARYKARGRIRHTKAVPKAVVAVPPV